ncbi:MAG: MFS transporter [Chloroflexota bacterium]
MSLYSRIQRSSRDLLTFAGASLILGIAYSMYDSVFNNFLNETYALTGFQRSFLEFPRELPGFLVVFVAALLLFWGSRRLSVFSILLSAVGVLLIAVAAPSYTIMLLWMFVYSLGQHLFMPLQATIGMELASEGRAGRRLGQLNAIRNFANILGSFLVLLGFRYLGFNFRVTFLIAAFILFIAAALLYNLKPDQPGKRKFLELHREYNLYYALMVLAGARKQLFITFAPWVLVTIFGQPTQIIATLLTISGIIGVAFQPMLGWAIDHYGERRVMAAEALILIGVCFGYGFARSLLPERTAFLVVCFCYLVDQMIFSVSMARSTYMKKIARQPDHIQSTLTAGVTIDHIFSISCALVGGVIWNRLGFQYVFLFGMLIAVINFFTALRVHLPGEPAAPTGLAEVPAKA